jgi:hypothetical protein
MSLPILKSTNIPSYLNTDLKELKEEVKKLLETPIQKTSQSPRKSPKEKNNNSTNKRRLRDAITFGLDEYNSIPTPRINEDIHMRGIISHKSPSPNHIINHKENIILSFINPNDLHTERMKIPEIKTTKSKRKQLEPVITQTHGSYFINDNPILPPIGKKAGKRRTRKHKSNRRRITLKK